MKNDIRTAIKTGMKTGIKKINVDKVLKDIKKEKRISKEIWERDMAPVLDIIYDGRTRYGKPTKKVAKVVDFIAMCLGYLALATMICYFIILWTM